MLHFTSTSEPMRNGSFHTLCDFVHRVEREIQRGTQISGLVLMFQGFPMLHQNFPRRQQSQSQPLISWLTTTKTLRQVAVYSPNAPQGHIAAMAFQWILRALLSRAPTLPAIPVICLGGPMTAEDLASLLELCRPARLVWIDSTILHTTLCPTNREAMEHIGAALRGTTSTLKTIEVSADQCLGGSVLRGLQNHPDYFSVTVCSIRGPRHVLLTQEHADALGELLRESTGERKTLFLLGSRWLSGPVFASLTSAFRDSSSYHEIGFQTCAFDAASSSVLLSAFSSEPKALKIGQKVIFPPDVNVLELLAGSSPGLGQIELSYKCELSHLEAIFHGLAMNTSAVRSLRLPTLPVNQLLLLLEALPKFTNLHKVKFATEMVPLSLKPKLLMAFKRNASLIESMTCCPFMDKVTSDKVNAYHIRNTYLPMTFESAIEEKTTEKDASGPGEFAFAFVPSLLRATIVATAASQGPTRVCDVLMRCTDKIGPVDF
jgi:hypothetical protein